MSPTNEPSREAVAATDAVFEEGSPAPVVEPVPPAAVPPAAEPEPRPREEDPSPLEDYVRELGEEYQEQQDEGKF